MAEPVKLKLRLDLLHERHPGLTVSLGGSFYEAAAVCFSRHHSSPVDLNIVTNDAGCVRTFEFPKPDARVINAWANEIDTTENGAYGVSLAALEAEQQMVAVRRAETQTGADWYVAPIGSVVEDLENCFRLEVSGVDAGSGSIVETRLKQKMAQTKRGNSNLPAIASVVGFKERAVAIRKVDEDK